MKVNLTIDGKQVEIRSGATMLDAARAIGIDIPTFCDHKYLKPFGACRMCVVEDAGSGRLFASCVTPVTQGMELLTTTEKVLKAREAIIELLLIYHPLDCPVCPQSGRCTLQDLAFAHGKESGRFGSVKVDKQIDVLSPLVEMNQNRCVQCGRCVRICDEVQGEGQLDFVERGFGTVVEPSFGRVMDCEFCGQCIQTCPVGALYSRPFKHTTPSWELTPVRTTCPFCGVGCTLNLEVRKDRIYHVLGVDDEGSNNSGFLCAKGRFGYEYVGRPERLKTPLVRKDGELVEATWEEAYQAIVDGVGAIASDGGGKALGGIASARCTNEENYLFQQFVRTVLGSDNVDSVARFSHIPAMEALYKAFGMAAPTDSLADLDQADLIFAVDANVTEDAHIVGLKVLRCVRYEGSKLIVANPRKIKLARFADSYLAMKPGTAVGLLNAMIHVILAEGLEDKEFVAANVTGLEELRKSVRAATPENAEKTTGVPADSIRDAAKALAASPAVTILLSPMTASYTGEDTVAAAANLAMITGNVGKAGSGILPLSEYNNVQGVMDMGAMPGYLPGHVPVSGETGMTVMEMVEAARAGTLKGLFIMGENPLTAFPEPARVAEALDKLEFLVVQDIFMNEAARKADVVLPAATGPEKDGTFTNTDRRVQRVRKALEAPGKAKADWKILCDLFEAFGKPAGFAQAMDVTRAIAGQIPSYAGILPERLEADGLHWPCPDAGHPGTPYLYGDGFGDSRAQLVVVEQREIDSPPADYPFVLISGTTLFHSGTTTKWARGLNGLAPEARVRIHPDDAKAAAINDGDRIRVASRKGEIEAVASVTSDSGKGIVFVPSHYADMPVNSLMEYDAVKEKTITFVTVSRPGGGDQG
ncbi:MAG: NADH-quinone oxidoreductase subunit NuoG [bacterium]|nr:NADH-quinone oxidoreductase subunit NuoG [bacterium]MDT8395442.1 NADH-quinone oxidoreductase subunit NuoG [bacterium]